MAVSHFEMAVAAVCLTSLSLCRVLAGAWWWSRLRTVTRRMDLFWREPRCYLSQKARSAASADAPPSSAAAATAATHSAAVSGSLRRGRISLARTDAPGPSAMGPGASPIGRLPSSIKSCSAYAGHSSSALARDSRAMLPSQRRTAGLAHGPPAEIDARALRAASSALGLPTASSGQYRLP